MGDRQTTSLVSDLMKDFAARTGLVPSLGPRLELAWGQQAIANELLHHRPVAARPIGEGLHRAVAQRVHGGDGQQVIVETACGCKGVSLAAGQELQLVDVPLHDLE